MEMLWNRIFYVGDKKHADAVITINLQYGSNLSKKGLTIYLTFSFIQYTITSIIKINMFQNSLSVVRAVPSSL